MKGTLLPIDHLPPIPDSLTQPIQDMTFNTYIAENQGWGNNSTTALPN